MILLQTTNGIIARTDQANSGKLQSKIEDCFKNFWSSAEFKSYEEKLQLKTDYKKQRSNLNEKLYRLMKKYLSYNELNGNCGYMDGKSKR
jgi:predicted DNA-binding protein YlxM (UPF0122 family)